MCFVCEKIYFLFVIVAVMAAGSLEVTLVNIKVVIYY